MSKKIEKSTETVEDQLSTIRGRMVAAAALGPILEGGILSRGL